MKFLYEHSFFFSLLYKNIIKEVFQEHSKTFEIIKQIVEFSSLKDNFSF